MLAAGNRGGRRRSTPISMNAPAHQLADVVAERPYLPTRLPHDIWAGLVADELSALSGDSRATQVERDWAARRAPRVRWCGTRALIQACRCGTAIPQSMHALPGPQGWCESRGCPVCARRRSAKLAGLADRAAAAVPAGSTWWLLTGTTARDPLDPVESDWTRLRARARQCRSAMSELVKLSRRRFTVAADWSGIEVVGNGHVHAHMLIVLPPGVADLAEWKTVDGVELLQQDRINAELVREAGFDEIADSRSADPGTVVEVVKYAVKSPSWEGAVDPGVSAVQFIHPRVAAHWALATRGMRLLERYGLARRVPIEVAPETDANVDPQQGLEACPCCGSVLDLDRWWCTGPARGLAAWARSTWKKGEGRLAGKPWDRTGPGRTEVALYAVEILSANRSIVVVDVDKPPPWRY